MFFWPTKIHTQKSSSPYRRMVKGASNAASSMGETVREYIQTYLLNSSYFSFFQINWLYTIWQDRMGFHWMLGVAGFQKMSSLCTSGLHWNCSTHCMSGICWNCSPASNCHHQDYFILSRESLSTFLGDYYWMGGRLKVCVLSGETSNISCFYSVLLGKWSNFTGWGRQLL